MRQCGGTAFAEIRRNARRMRDDAAGGGIQLRSWAGCRWRHLVRGYGQRTDVSEAMSPIAMGSLS